MTKRFFLMAVSSALMAISAVAVPQRKALIDDGWRFRMDGAAEWRTVDLPHDWSVEQPAAKDAPAGGAGGYRLTGLRKPISHYRNMLWNGEDVYLAVREPDGYHGTVKTTLWGTWPTWESWNWPGWEGKPIEVEVYSRQPSVKLYLDDQLVGTQATKEMKATFTLPYKPGTLRAEAGGQTVTLATASEPVGLRLTTVQEELAKGLPGQLSFVTIEVVDAQGRVCPDADPLLHFTLKGKGRLLAVGNADIKDTAPFVATERKAWKGRALCVVKGHGRLTVTADGLKTAAVTY